MEKEESDYPDDYEQCGYCNYDHSYEYEKARQWHEENDPTHSLYK